MFGLHARVILSLLGSLLTCFVLAGTAVAGTAALAGNTLSFADSPGAATTLAVSDNGIAVVVVNSTGTLTPSTGCVTVSSSSVSCAYSIASKPSVIDLEMGDQQDGATIDASVSAATTTVANDIGNFTAGLGPVIVDANDPLSDLIGGPYGDFLDSKGGTIDGGPGNDKIQMVDGGGIITGGDGDDHMDAGGADASITYQASEGDDFFFGGRGDDEIVFGWDHDIVFGGPGDDRFYDSGDGNPSSGPGDNDSEVWAGPGDDILTDWDPSTNEQSHYDGGPGRDVITYLTATAPTTPIHISMDDSMDDGASGETDHIHQSVEVVGRHPSLFTQQMEGPDTITGSAADNLLDGRYGNDVIDGAGGDDEVVGDNGADTLTGGPGDDIISGGSGVDTASYSGAALPVTVSLATSSAQNTVGAGVDTLTSIAKLIGGAGADTLTGDGAANTITGGAGADTIDAGGGTDLVEAADGQVDTIDCGAGTDAANVDAGDSVTGCETVNII